MEQVLLCKKKQLVMADSVLIFRFIGTLASEKVETGNIFLSHDFSCNITQQHMKETSTLNSTQENKSKHITTECGRFCFAIFLKVNNNCMFEEGLNKNFNDVGFSETNNDFQGAQLFYVLGG